MGARQLRANLLLLLAATIWGFAFVAQREAATNGMSAWGFNGTRFWLGALSLLPVIAVLDRRRLGHDELRHTPRDSWRAVLVPGVLIGLVLFGAASLQQIGVETTTAGNAGFITGLYMVLVPVIGIGLGHRTHRNIWLGIVLALAGLYLLSVTDGLSIHRGDLLVLLGTPVWAAHILLIDHFSPQVDPLRLSVAQFATCAALNDVVGLSVDEVPFAGLGATVWWVLFAGLMSVGVAYTLQVVAQRDALPSHAAMILSLEALFGALGGALLLGERMTGRAYVGCGLMMAGILLAQVKPRSGAGSGGATEVPVGGIPAPVPEPKPAMLDET